ncbi:MAG: hypothetical protein KQI81_01350 [Deltaproteobacteria bacterium]|nr:hypothetical protein [Deltaproteobacteria bacterium]
MITGFDAIEGQGGHGYLVSQLLNRKTNSRTDRYGHNRIRLWTGTWSPMSNRICCDGPRGTSESSGDPGCRQPIRHDVHRTGGSSR